MSGRETYRYLAPRSAFLETMPTSEVSGDQFFPHTPYDPAASANVDIGLNNRESHTCHMSGVLLQKRRACCRCCSINVHTHCLPWPGRRRCMLQLCPRFVKTFRRVSQRFFRTRVILIVVSQCSHAGFRSPQTDDSISRVSLSVILRAVVRAGAVGVLWGFACECQKGGLVVGADCSPSSPFDAKWIVSSLRHGRRAPRALSRLGLRTVAYDANLLRLFVVRALRIHAERRALNRLY